MDTTNNLKDLVWSKVNGSLYLVDKQKNTSKTIENMVYEVNYSDFTGFSLMPVIKKFEFPYKIYGLETDIIKRVLKYYKNTDSGNLGILLNGTKGTGKTVTSKILCNELKLPVIIISTPYRGVEDYINSIPQDVVVFIDEYEKIYKESHDFLTIMDGALNSPNRRVFLMTTNNLYVDQNLIDRPSRVRYLKTFDNLSPEIVEEIVDDLLQYIEYKDDCIKFISMLDIITVDIVKTIVNEVNIQEESPMVFRSVFNASVKKGKYKIFYKNGAKFEELLAGAKVSPRINFGDHCIGNSLYINDDYVGKITEVLDYNTINVQLWSRTEEEEYGKDLVAVLQSESKPEVQKIIRPFNLVDDIVTFVIREDYSFNDTYKYGKTHYSEFEHYNMS